MSTEVGRDLVIKWVPVTSETRINAVTSGQVDLECGSTTSNLERKKVVDFSPVIFIAGHQADGEEGLARQVVPRSCRALGRRDERHDQREGDARPRREVQAEHDDRDGQRPRRLVRAARVRQGRRVRDRRRAALWIHRDEPRAGPARGGRRLPVVRSVRHHVPPQRSAARDTRHRHDARRSPPRASSSRPTPSGSCASCPPDSASTCR